jgi:hypothetical protein
MQTEAVQRACLFDTVLERCGISESARPGWSNRAWTDEAAALATAQPVVDPQGHPQSSDASTRRTVGDVRASANV